MPHKRKQLDVKENDLWYIVGLIASDGNLSGDGRHITIVSEHEDYLQNVRRALGLKNKIGWASGGKIGKMYPRLQFASRDFYDFLRSVGLMPKKSKILRNLEIPYWGFADFVRGLIDGDGSILRWIHPTNGREQWSLKVVSAAPVFSTWLKNAVETWFGVKGGLHQSRAGLFSVKFGKLAAQRILAECYYDGSLALSRKAASAAACIASVPGWSSSKTVSAAY